MESGYYAGRRTGCQPNVSITVENTIPDQAGLGGSSADAAATPRALAKRWGINALDPRVVAVARRVVLTYRSSCIRYRRFCLCGRYAGRNV